VSDCKHIEIMENGRCFDCNDECTHENITLVMLNKAYYCDDCHKEFTVYEVSDEWAKMKKLLREKK